MRIAKQLAIFLDNRPGMLAEVCRTLAAENINILALTTSDTVDHSVIRMVVDKTREALLLFEERGTLVVEDDVLLVEAPNRPGALAQIAGRLAAANINIEYCYCASNEAAEKGLLVLRVAHPAKALKALKKLV